MHKSLSHVPITITIKLVTLVTALAITATNVQSINVPPAFAGNRITTRIDALQLIIPFHSPHPIPPL